MTDIVERLREVRPDFIQESWAIMKEAADVIELMELDRAILKAMLKGEYNNCTCSARNVIHERNCLSRVEGVTHVTRGDVRRDLGLYDSDHE